MVYYGADNAQHRPVMIHRTVLGSIERFIGALIEHYSGEFPLWLAPVQAVVAPICEKHSDYAGQVYAELKEGGLRVELDDRNETVAAKIRDARLKKVPYTLVVGDNEIKERTLAVRDKGGKRQAGCQIGRLYQGSPAGGYDKDV